MSYTTPDSESYNCICDEPEVWKRIPGYENFRVSNHGRVKGKSGKILNKQIAGEGYHCVNLWPDGNKYIHRLVLRAFDSVPKEGQETNHIDGDKKHNCIGNLEWVTTKENKQHAMEMGLMSPGTPKKALNQWGEQNSQSKLTEIAIKEIRRLWENTNMKQREIGKKFGVNQPYISEIINEKVWPHVKGPPVIFIAGPMSKFSDEDWNYRSFHAAAKDLRNAGYAVVNPAEKVGGFIGLKRSWYLLQSIFQIPTCDYVVCLKEWQESEGAMLEAHLADALGKDLYYYTEEEGLIPVEITSWSVEVRKKG